MPRASPASGCPNSPANLHDLLKVALRRNDHAASTHYRLRDEGGNGVRVLAANQFVQFTSEPPREFLFRLPRVRETIMMRTASVQNARDRQIEIEMIVGQTRERGRHY